MKSNELFLKLKNIWNIDIKNIYNKGIINNERQLQAYIFKYFNDIFREDNQIWIELLLIINKNKSLFQPAAPKNL